MAALNGPREIEQVRRALDVRPAQFLDRRVYPEVGCAVNDVRDRVQQSDIGRGLQTQARRADIAALDLYACADGVREFTPVPPRARQSVPRGLAILRADQRDNCAIGLLNQPPCDLCAEKARRPGEENNCTHAATSQP